ncbi:hypothetical protein IMZ31_24395 (plasmid) [Pontibacillus sp. ALD_SL1]|uniref:hypothetical protein n=1 Tax=Pontibacillus sp. ALD_SL1 TaxID=2777185 RepID=UPI001A95B2CD|nr:hypothetical protein [Pontibacillus sp. ALD_SL1]QST02594.1 hypothetical protein IMZ31_24395 [Pontibacillus sp. ALD_SL1]
MITTIENYVIVGVHPEHPMKQQDLEEAVKESLAWLEEHRPDGDVCFAYKPVEKPEEFQKIVSEFATLCSNL